MSTMTIEERAQEFYDRFFDQAQIHLMDVAEGLKKPNKAEIEVYGDAMKLEFRLKGHRPCGG